MDNLARRQIVIPASRQPENITLRVAAYCRVSTDSEDQLNSFAAQNRHYTDFIAGMPNWQLVDIYADEGITGTSAKKRPDFQRLLTDCRNGLVDKILVKSISRFARNTKECLEIIRELKVLGIGVSFEEQHIDTKTASSEMLTAVMAALAQKESESISQNVKWAIQKKMMDGSYIPSHMTFGFRREGGRQIIQEEEAKYFRYIAASYLSGRNATELAEEMAERSKTDPILRSYKWTYRTIIRLLQNEKFAGDTLHQKTYMTETLPRRCVDNRGELEQYYVTNSHPAIISREESNAIQRLIAQRGELRQFTREKASPFVGMTVCGNCGTGFRYKKCNGKVFLVCRTHTEDLDACGIPQIPEEEFKNTFCRMYFNLMQNNGRIIRDMLRDLETIRFRQALWSKDIVTLNSRISDIQTQSHTLAVLNKQGLVDSDFFISQSNQLAQQLRQAKQEKNRILAAEKNPTIDKTREILEILETGPVFPETFDEELLYELVDKIIVDSKTQIRFRLINGLELKERVERITR